MEDSLIPEEILSQIRHDMEKYNIVRYRVNDILKEIGEDIKEENFENIYWNLKIAFYNEGIIIRTTRTKDFEKIFVMRQKRIGDEYPKTIKEIWKDHPGKLILSGNIVKLMENLKNESIRENLEYGFYLLYKEDLKIFSGELEKGTEELILLEPIIPEGVIIFGWFHVHLAEKFKEDDQLEKELSALPSLDDIFSSIDDYLNERRYNHSIMMISSELDDYVHIYIPKENISDNRYREVMDTIIASEKGSAIDKFKILTDVIEIFHILNFELSVEKDIIIEYNPITRKYSLI